MGIKTQDLQVIFIFCYPMKPIKKCNRHQVRATSEHSNMKAIGIADFPPLTSGKRINLDKRQVKVVLNDQNLVVITNTIETKDENTWFKMDGLIKSYMVPDADQAVGTTDHVPN